MPIITPDPNKIQIISPNRPMLRRLRPMSEWLRKHWLYLVSASPFGLLQAGKTFVRWMWHGLWEDRVMSGTNHFLDENAHWLKPVAVFVLDHPMLLFILVISGIFIHAYLSTSPLVQSPLPQSDSVSLQEDSPIATGAPKVILEYRWREHGEMGKRDTLGLPVTLRNDGDSVAVNVQVKQLRAGKWDGIFDLIPHLHKGEPKILQAKTVFDGLHSPGSAGVQLATILKPNEGTDLRQDQATPVKIAYMDMEGEKYTSEYEFVWDHKKQEINSILVKYGKSKQDKKEESHVNVNAPDVFLEWALPNPEFPGISNEKEIIVVNRSATDYAYNILLEPLTLATTLRFGKVNEIKPGGRIPLQLTLEGMEDPHYQPFVRFFVNPANTVIAEQKGFIKKNAKGMAEFRYSLPLALTYSSKSGACTTAIQLEFDSWNGARFELLSRR
jgi:hypothetical protein